MEKILGILYGNIDEKFVVDPETGKCYLNPDVIRNLKDFNTFKRMVGFCADANTKLIDLSLLMSYINQIDLRLNILKINRRNGNLDYPEDVDETQLFLGSIKEFNLANPNGAISSLQQQSEVIDDINSKIDNLTQRMKELHEIISIKQFNDQSMMVGDQSLIHP